MDKIKFLLIAGLLAAASSAGAYVIQENESTSATVDGGTAVDKAVDSLKSLLQTQIRTAEPMTLQPAGTASDYKAVQNGASRVFPETNNIGSQGGAQIKMENAQTNPMYKDSGTSGQNPFYEGQTPKVRVRGWDAEKKEVLRNFEKNTENIAEQDKNIGTVELSPETLKVEYKRPAKLFGFIPVAYYHAFTVDGKGNIAQGHPWWLILATSDANNFASTVVSDFKKQQDQLRWVKAPTALELAAQHLSALAGILKARHDASQQAISNLK